MASPYKIPVPDLIALVSLRAELVLTLAGLVLHATATLTSIVELNAALAGLARVTTATIDVAGNTYSDALT